MYLSYFKQRVNGSNDVVYQSTDYSCDGGRLFTARPYYFHGSCYSLRYSTMQLHSLFSFIRIPNCLAKPQITKITFDLKTEQSDIFIHHQGQFMSSNSRNRVAVKRGEFLELAIFHEVVELLQESGSGCVKNYSRVDTVAKSHSTWVEETYDFCMYSILEYLLNEEVRLQFTGRCLILYFTGRMYCSLAHQQKQHLHQ